MTRTTSARWIFQRRRWLEALFSLSLLGFFASPGEASPIRQHRITARGARDLRMWTSYLAGGSNLWSQTKAPRISAAVNRAIVGALRSADPRSTPWVQYLLWRQGRNIARFNFYHPVLGPILEQLPPPTTPPTPPPAGGEIIPPPDPEPPHDPEPSSILLALGMVAAGYWWRSRAGRSSRVLATT